MSKTIVVCGHGPGISDAVAHKFGKEGFSVAIVARNKERLTAAAQKLEQAGIKAKAVAGNLGDPDALAGIIDAARELGPIAALHWNAYGGGAGDLTTAKAADLREVLDVSVHGLLAALQAALPDLKAQKGSLLVTGGGLGFHDEKVDAMAVEWGAMGLAVGKSAQHKVVGLLAQKLKGEGIYVGEVVVLGLVKGTPWDRGNATLEPADIASKFWELTQARSTTSVRFG
ncbi:MAG: SDR family NAD(P)-dependent oxidoreductase [Myxococcales bacterium]|nr:SDR family NAD(P)-dependent oxidoreductase [Myxococcales bacterium]